MAFQSAPNCAEAVINVVADGQPMANVLNFVKPGGYTQTDIDNLAVAIDGAVGSHYKALMHNGCTYGSTLVRGLSDVNDLTQTDVTSAGVGTGGATTLPSNVSFVVTLRSSLTGRSGRGRLYMMPMAASALATVNGVSSTFAANAASMVTAIKSNASAVGWTLVILSRFTAGSKRATAVPFTVVSISSRNLTCDSQRNRLPRGH